LIDAKRIVKKRGRLTGAEVARYKYDLKEAEAVHDSL
jgi:hypothetical protein